MDENLFVLLIPVVDLMPIKGDVVGNRRAGWDRFFVAPHDFVVGAVPTLHRIVDSLALVGGEGTAGALLEEIHADRGDREVVDRLVVGRVEDEPFSSNGADLTASLHSPRLRGRPGTNT